MPARKRTDRHRADRSDKPPADPPIAAEDASDVEAIEQRRNGPTFGFEEVVRALKRSGKL
jgi:hypothetical protein